MGSKKILCLMIMFMFFLFNLVSADYPSEMKAWWKFDGNLQDDFDAHHGIWGGEGSATYADGKFGKSVSFDGSHHVTVSYSEDFHIMDDDAMDDDLTIDLWVKVNNLEAIQHLVGTDKGHPTVYFDYWGINVNQNGEVSFHNHQSESSCGANDGVGMTISGGDISDNNWHHIAVIKKASDVGLYVDGVQVDWSIQATPTEDGCYTSHLDLRFGAWYDFDPNTGGYKNYLDGSLDNVRVINSNFFNANPNEAKTDIIEVLGKDCPMGILNYWNFDDTGTTAVDLIGANDGTINGASSVTGKSRNAFEFDGSINEKITLNSPVQIADNVPWTILYWYNSDGTANNTYYSPVGHIEDGYNRVEHINYPDFDYYFITGDGSSVVFDSVLDVGPGWHHIALVNDGSDSNNLELYIDKTSKGKLSKTMTDINFNLVGENWYGKLDEIAIYTRALTEEEIQGHYLKGLSGVGYCEKDLDEDQKDCERYGKIWLNSSKFENGTIAQCCEDDSGEYYRTRGCGEGVCISYTEDYACCNEKKDCVYNSICYTNIFNGSCEGSYNTCMDLDDDSDDLEICTLTGWQDPDNNQEACEEANNHPRATKWMINGICGMREIEQGDCNDMGMTSDFCCGDDKNETIIEGYDDVCFIKENDCYSYLNNRYYTEGEYAEDMFCENGVLTSRIKSVSLQLIDIANQVSPDDYTLFCDSYENTLNYFWYYIWGFSVNLYLNMVNNICVLKLPEQVIFGASLNQPINEGQYSFIDTLVGIDSCDDIEEDGKFHQCISGDSRAWYNIESQSIIYSNEDIIDISSDFELSFWEKFLLFLKHPFQVIFDFLLSLFEQEGHLEDYRFINSTKEFSRIYLNKKESKSIMGIAEEIKEPLSGEYISVTYNGYASDICSTVDKVYERFIRQGQLDRKDMAVCYYDSGSYYVATNSSISKDLWPELTAKLRPQEGPLCIDSDGGNDFFVRGTTCGYSGYPPTEPTECVSDTCEGDTLIEFMVNEDCVIVNEQHGCLNGCEDGACKSGAIPLSCEELSLVISTSYGATCLDQKYDKLADIDNDGDVDLYDLATWGLNSNDGVWCSEQLADMFDPCP